MTEIIGCIEKIKEYVEKQNNHHKRKDLNEQIDNIKNLINDYDNKSSNMNDLLKYINELLESMNKKIVSIENRMLTEKESLNIEKIMKKNKLDKLRKWCDLMAERNHILFLLDNINNCYYCCTQTKYNYGPHDFNSKSKFNNFIDTLRFFPGETYCILNEENYKIYLITKNKIRNFHTMIQPKINNSISKMILNDKFVNLNL